MIDIERLIVMIMLYRDSGHTSPFFLDFGHSIRPHSIAKGEQNCKKSVILWFRWKCNMQSLFVHDLGWHSLCEGFSNCV